MLSVIVSVPVGDGLLNSIFPETVNVLVRSSQAVRFVVMAIIEQKTTMLQLVTPELAGSCSKVIVPGSPLQFESRRM